MLLSYSFSPNLFENMKHQINENISEVKVAVSDINDCNCFKYISSCLRQSESKESKRKYMFNENPKNQRNSDHKSHKILLLLLFLLLFGCCCSMNSSHLVNENTNLMQQS